MGTPGEPVRALLLENVHPEGVAALTGAGFAVETVDRALGAEELRERLQGTHLLGIRSKTHLTGDVLRAADDLVAIGAFCIGTNQIDLATASDAGIAVFNAPFSNTRSVVELVLGEVVALTRRLTEKNTAMHAGLWDKSAAGAHEIRGRTLGIVGYGNIGSQLSVLAEALGMSVLFYDTADKLALGNARRCESLEALLRQVDVVSLHIDGRASNKLLFGAAEFAAMRRGSIFLNLSRGFVVDHEALRDSIVSGHLAGAAVDVFPDEPHARGDGFVSDLRGLPNVILTPHIGGSTEEAQEDIGRYVAGKMRDYVADGTTTMSVNLPHLAFPLRDGAHRIAYVHRNVPGVLATINGVLADADLNIESQLLGTRGNVGYVLSDAASPYPQEVLDQLLKLPHTVRLRALP